MCPADDQMIPRLDIFEDKGGYLFDSAMDYQHIATAGEFLQFRFK